jgi:hypothetical protein
MWKKNHNINIVNTTFINVAKIKFLGMIVTDQNYIYEELKNNLNLFWKISLVLHRNLKNKIYTPTILYIVSHAYETLKMNVACSSEILLTSVDYMALYPKRQNSSGWTWSDLENLGIISHLGFHWHIT